jgi:hypothetical protein
LELGIFIKFYVNPTGEITFREGNIEAFDELNFN